MKLEKPAPTLNKKLTQKLFSKNESSDSKKIELESKELPELKRGEKIEINSIIGKSYSDF